MAKVSPWLLGLFIAMLVGCSGYRPKPIVPHDVLRDLQRVRLEALARPETTPSAPPAFDLNDGLSADEAVAVGLFLNPGLRSFRKERGVAEGELVAARLLPNPELEITWLYIQNLTKSFLTGGFDVGLRWPLPGRGSRPPSSRAPRRGWARCGRKSRTRSGGSPPTFARRTPCGVIEAALRGAEYFARLQVCKQVDQANFGPGSLDVGDRRADGRLGGGAGREHRAESLLGSQQPCPRRTRLGEHGVDQELGRWLLVHGQPAAVLQLEHVHRARVALLVRGEGEPESAAVRDDAIEFLQPPVDRPVIGVAAALVVGSALAAGLAAITTTAAIAPTPIAPTPSAVIHGFIKEEAEGRWDASVNAGYQRQDFGFDLRWLTDSGATRSIRDVFHYVGAGVTVTLPVRNRNQGNVAATRAESRAMDRRRELAELTARHDVAAAFAQANAARQALALYERGVRDVAGRNVEVVHQASELGRGSLLDVIAEQRRFIEVETGYTEALKQAWDATTEIERAVGAPLP